ncbi:hypothetical protein CDAR_445511 [Caerostris darwini]|uniref:Uncharacterized protein n=1 Tax=Caerostris darwini TaxID=1538125 RepID=A0AAV4Q165_9ARAC|nr:hypothetical protein CDAR_445511 [Caerostris darwini]
MQVGETVLENRVSVAKVSSSSNMRDKTYTDEGIVLRAIYDIKDLGDIELVMNDEKTLPKTNLAYADSNQNVNEIPVKFSY